MANRWIALVVREHQNSKHASVTFDSGSKATPKWKRQETGRRRTVACSRAVFIIGAVPPSCKVHIYSTSEADAALRLAWVAVIIRSAFLQTGRADKFNGHIAVPQTSIRDVKPPPRPAHRARYIQLSKLLSYDVALVRARGRNENAAGNKVQRDKLAKKSAPAAMHRILRQAYNVGRRCWQHEQLPFDAREREKLALEKNVTDRKARWHLSNKRVKKHIAARLSWVGNFLFPAARLIFRLGILSGCGRGFFLAAKPAKFKFAAARAVAAQRCLYISGDKIILYRLLTTVFACCWVDSVSLPSFWLQKDSSVSISCVNHTIFISDKKCFDIKPSCLRLSHGIYCIPLMTHSQ